AARAVDAGTRPARVEPTTSAHRDHRPYLRCIAFPPFPGVESLSLTTSPTSAGPGAQGRNGVQIEAARGRRAGERPGEDYGGGGGISREAGRGHRPIGRGGRRGCGRTQEG